MMEEDQLKNIIKDAQVKAGEHFTNRVMHQIETEQALQPRKKETPVYSPGAALGVFGVMYGVLLLTGWFFYVPSDSNLIESSLFLKISGLIASVCGFFYLISVFDDAKIYRRKPSKS